MKNDINNFYYKNNRLQQLRGFCYAAQFGNISKAAERMNLTHSTVSIQIKTLEEDFKIKLFERNGPNIKITTDGERLLKLSLPYIEGIDNLQLEFKKELKIEKRTEFHIATNSTGLNFILPKIMKKYLNANKDINITIHYAEYHEALKKLKSGEVELALLPKREHLPFPDYSEYLPVFFHEVSLITQLNHPLAGRKNLSVEEISRYPLTLPAEDLRVIPDLYNIFPKNNIDKKLRIKFVNWETTRKYIEQGLVISISSDVIISDEEDTLMATSLKHLFPKISYGYVSLKNKELPEKINNLIEASRDIYSERKWNKVYRDKKKSK